MSAENTIEKCPALFISATASGQGKTTVTAALAWHYRQQGLQVRVFKTGPDFLDPKILEVASGYAVYQLDLWMTGEQQCRELLYQAASQVDLILIEGVMGLFDGDPSSADLAKLFNLPVVAVIDASAMAGTFGAVAHGLKYFDPQLNLLGVLANRIGGNAHANMLRESLADNIKWFGALSRNNEIRISERHLGLLPAEEIKNLPEKLSMASTMLAQSGLCELSSITATEFHSPKAANQTARQTSNQKKSLSNVKIGIAQDAAFCFCYPANIDTLQALGAELIYFSPINDTSLPDIDSLYLPGGYPELHLKPLQNNQSMQDSIREHYHLNKPIFAECGGLLYLTEAITDKNAVTGKMIGIISGAATLQNRLVNLSMQSMCLTQGDIRGDTRGDIRGHSYHHSKLSTSMPIYCMTKPNGKYGAAEAVYRSKKLIASYMHLYMPSNPQVIAKLFQP